MNVAVRDGALPDSASLPHPRPRLAATGRLSPAVLEALPRTVKRPRYEVAALRTGILHIGCGAFHRAHQAVMTQRAIEAETARSGIPPAWGIAAASLRSMGVVDGLARQQGLYTVVERARGGSSAEVVGALREPLHALRDAERLSTLMLDPHLRLITLTVTESGYCADTGRLDLSHPDVAADLLGRRPPRSVPGLLVRAMSMRRAAGLAPPVLISCDNLPGNGRLLRQVCLDMAARQSEPLAVWIERHVQFPCSMVDRIVPATTDADRTLASRLIGVDDGVPVTTEPFTQWVIEHFDGPRPCWEAGGAEFVDDVAPWEASKLRLLNGGHLALACLGLLAGFSTVAEAMREPVLAAYALRLLVDEQRPTLPPSNHDIRAYARQLVARWRNPDIAHQLERVGRNASDKLHPRLLAGLLVHLAAGRPAPLTVLAVGAWIWCACGRPPSGRVLADHDHLRDDLLRLGEQSHGNAQALVQGFLGLRSVFGDELPRHGGFVKQLVQAVRTLQQDGALGAVRAALSAHVQPMQGDPTP
jgi:fructuronate reductase